MDLSHLGRREKGGQKVDPLERIAADIGALRAAHVVEPLMLQKSFILAAAGDSDTFDSQGRRVSWIIAQAFTGVIDVYWTDGGGGEPTSDAVRSYTVPDPYTCQRETLCIHC